MVARKTIGMIKFGILSPEMIRKMSTVEVKVAETYDEDGFPIEGGLMDPHMGVADPGLRCKTCGQKMNKCPGHFGRIELVRPVIHSEYARYIEYFLNGFCPKCGRPLVSEQAFSEIVAENPPKKRLKVLAKKGAAVKKCPHCGAERQPVRLDRPTNFFEGDRRIWPTEIRERLEKIHDADLERLGFDPKNFRPEWLVLTVLPVPPVTVRPSIVLETGERAEDDLTHKLADIVRINQRLKENIDAGAPQLIIEDLWDLLQYHVTTYFNNEASGVPPARHRSGRILKTVIQRLKGKEGRFRYNLSGKRVNFAGRAVISPDPMLDIDQVGVPEWMANIVTVPMQVTEWNIDEAKRYVAAKEYPRALYVIRPDGTRKRVTDTNREELLEELAPGYTIERQVVDGDVVLFNRQPSLHRMSMMALKVKVLPGRTLRIQPAVCPPYNADFDGDEMNIHFLQTREAQVEARELMLTTKHVITPRYGGPIIGLTKDYITALFLLTLPWTRFPKEQAMDILYAAGITELPEADEDGMISGRAIFSMLLPDDLTMKFPSTLGKHLVAVGLADKKGKGPISPITVIENGKLVRGVIDKAAVGTGKGKLLDYMYRRYGEEFTKEFISRVSKMANRLLYIFGFTNSYHSLKTPEEIDRKIDEIVQRALEKVYEYVRQYNEGKLEPIPGRDVRESLEIYIMVTLSQAEKEVQTLLQRYLLETKLDPVHVLDNFAQIFSGARGSFANIKNLMGVQGQAAVREKRPHRGFYQRVTAHYKRGDLGPFARGFARSNLRDGLTMNELFFWGMGGRMGEVDKGVSTQITGYYYRRLSNAMMDLLVFPDGTVREVTRDTIVQFVYGDDGINPQKLRHGEVPLDVLYDEIKAGGKK